MTDAEDIEYRFVFDDGHEWRYKLPIGNPVDGAAVAEAPEWVRLNYHKCAHCPLDAATRDCPVAVRLQGLTDAVGGLVSYTQANIEVRTVQRTISCRTSVQRGLGSLLGMLIATSACPHTAFLQPMAHFHLPFASEEETAYRAVSMYLLAQYLRGQSGLEVDSELTGLVSLYRKLEILNAAIADRLRSACTQDAAINGIVLLDLLAKLLPQSVDDGLADIRPLFAYYLDSAERQK